MEKYIIKYDADDKIYTFLVKSFPFKDGETCRYSIFFEDKLIASFEPDNHHSLNICKNTGNFDEELLGLLADEIEYRHPNLIIHPEDHQK